MHAPTWVNIWWSTWRGASCASLMEQLIAAIKEAQRVRMDALLVVHGYGASGAGGVIKAALVQGRSLRHHVGPVRQIFQLPFGPVSPMRHIFLSGQLTGSEQGPIVSAL